MTGMRVLIAVFAAVAILGLVLAATIFVFSLGAAVFG